MKKESLKKCITLIGPSSVGKSLLTPILSKKLGMPYFCVDDFLIMVDYEMGGFIGPSPEQQKQFKKDVLEELKQDQVIAKQIEDEKTRPQVIALINDFVKEYNHYVKLLGDLKPYYSIVSKFYSIRDIITDPKDTYISLALAAAELLDKVLSKLDQPIIIDAPAPFGWNTERIEIPHRVEKYMKKRNFQIDAERCKRVTKRVLSETTSVYLEPGVDYADRNGMRKHKANNLILKDLSAYEDVAKITVSMNGMFFDTKHPSLRKREWFNARANTMHDKLKNRAEIKNVCEQIIDLREYVAQTRSV